MPPRRLLSIGHSYVVSANRRLTHAIAAASNGRYEVTAAAPTLFHGKHDLRTARLDLPPGEPVPVRPLPAYLTFQPHVFFYGRGLRKLLRENWDLVHCWQEPFLVAGAQVAWHTPARTPFVFRSAQSLPKRYFPPFSNFERMVVRRAAGWICSGETVRANLLGRPGYAEKPHALIPLGVDVGRFYSDPAAGKRVRTELGWTDPGPPVVGFLGRFIPEKGLDTLTEALDRLRTPWRALIVGGGPLEANLRTWAARHPDAARVVTGVGHDDVPAYLNAMAVLAAPSRTTPRWKEQFGRMIVEAFACETPVLGSDSGEIPNVLAGIGTVVPETNVAAWVDSLGAVLENPALRATLGAAGREKAVTQYTWESVGARHVEFFDRVLGIG